MKKKGKKREIEVNFNLYFFKFFLSKTFFNFAKTLILALELQSANLNLLVLLVDCHVICFAFARFTYGN